MKKIPSDRGAQTPNRNVLATSPIKSKEESNRCSVGQRNARGFRFIFLTHVFDLDRKARHGGGVQQPSDARPTSRWAEPRLRCSNRFFSRRTVSRTSRKRDKLCVGPWNRLFRSLNVRPSTEFRLLRIRTLVWRVHEVHVKWTIAEYFWYFTRNRRVRWNGQKGRTTAAPDVSLKPDRRLDKNLKSDLALSLLFFVVRVFVL